MLKKIISGGQTGADIAALDAAIEYGIDYGGSIPKGRLTESGPLAERYQLTELQSSSYPARTEKNVLDSDGTVIFSHGELSGGSLLTKKMAITHGRPYLHVNMKLMGVEECCDQLLSFLLKNKITVLNVAGPRASCDENIYNGVRQVMNGFLSKLETRNCA